MGVTKIAAATIIASEAAIATEENASPFWLKAIQRFSEMSAPTGVPKTHVAMLGTALLAKATDLDADLREVKPSSSKAKNAYSARTLCHDVLVPAAARFGFNIGATGREPLNNQPYFRIQRVGDGTPISKAGRPVFDELINLIAKLEGITSKDEAASALRAFVVVRRTYQPRYAAQRSGTRLTLTGLKEVIVDFVSESSQGGRRAQAVTAGLVDALVGSDRVESGRINDPSRKTPGDVIVFSSDEGRSVQKAIEVRDKSVTTTDVLIFANRCLAFGVPEAGVVAISRKQADLDCKVIEEWSARSGLAIAIFEDWADLLEPVAFWSETPTADTLTEVSERIGIRLQEMEAGPDALARWQELLADQNLQR